MSTLHCHAKIFDLKFREMPIWIIILIVGIAAIVFPLFLISSNQKAMSRYKCFAFDDQSIFLKGQDILRKNKISFSFMGWTPSQDALMQPGTSSHAPKELWVEKKDFSEARRLLSKTLSLKNDEHAVIVSERAP